MKFKECIQIYQGPPFIPLHTVQVRCNERDLDSHVMHYSKHSLLSRLERFFFKYQVLNILSCDKYIWSVLKKTS